MTLLQCSWLFLMCFGLGWRSYQQCNGNMLCFAPDMVINEYVASQRFAYLAPPPASGGLIAFHQRARAGLFVCADAAGGWRAALPARPLGRVKPLLSAVVDSQCFFALIDSVIAFLRRALRAGGQPAGLQWEKALFAFCLFS